MSQAFKMYQETHIQKILSTYTQMIQVFCAPLNSTNTLLRRKAAQQGIRVY